MLTWAPLPRPLPCIGMAMGHRAHPHEMGTTMLCLFGLLSRRLTAAPCPSSQGTSPGEFDTRFRDGPSQLYATRGATPEPLSGPSVYGRGPRNGPSPIRGPAKGGKRPCDSFNLGRPQKLPPPSIAPCLHQRAWVFTPPRLALSSFGKGVKSKKPPETVACSRNLSPQQSRTSANLRPLHHSSGNHPLKPRIFRGLDTASSEQLGMRPSRPSLA